MTLPVAEGFCYHCLNCEYNTGFERAYVNHSEKFNHGLVRRFRGNCNEHNGKSA